MDTHWTVFQKKAIEFENLDPSEVVKYPGDNQGLRFFLTKDCGNDIEEIKKNMVDNFVIIQQNEIGADGSPTGKQSATKGIYFNESMSEGIFMQGGDGQKVYFYEVINNAINGLARTVESDGTIYTGEVTKGVYHGVYKSVRENVEVIGTSKDGVMGGYAELRKKEEAGTLVIKGEINELGSFEGQCWADFGTHTFEGEFKNSNPYKGKSIFHQEGGVYEGEVDKQAKPCGKGKMVVGEITFNGTFDSKGLLQGKGSYFMKQGKASFDGEFIDGRVTGTGTLVVEETGTKYTGSFLEGKYHGEGTLEQNGSVYKGNFEKGNFSGEGTLTLPNGDSYSGIFQQDGGIHGKGKANFANGCSYEGEFVNNKFDGKGKITYADGKYFEGSFVDGKRQGEGVTFSATGEELSRGQYKNDVLEGQENSAEEHFKESMGITSKGDPKVDKFSSFRLFKNGNSLPMMRRPFLGSSYAAKNIAFRFPKQLKSQKVMLGMMLGFGYLQSKM